MHVRPVSEAALPLRYAYPRREASKQPTNSVLQRPPARSHRAWSSRESYFTWRNSAPDVVAAYLDVAAA